VNFSHGKSQMCSYVTILFIKEKVPGKHSGLQVKTFQLCVNHICHQILEGNKDKINMCRHLKIHKCTQETILLH